MPYNDIVKSLAHLFPQCTACMVKKRQIFLLQRCPCNYRGYQKTERNIAQHAIMHMNIEAETTHDPNFEVRICDDFSRKKCDKISPILYIITHVMHVLFGHISVVSRI